jgi:hypothetical protein
MGIVKIRVLPVACVLLASAVISHLTRVLAGY